MFNASAVTIQGDIGAGLAGLPRFDSSTRDVVVARMVQDYSEIRNDSVLTAAFARQLEYIYKKLYEVEYPAFRANDFIPLSTEVPPGALTHTYRMYNRTGAAKVIHNYAADLPNSDVEGGEWPAPIITLGTSYNFSVVDIQRAALANVPIEAMKGKSARLNLEFLMEQIAAVGSSANGVVGLTNAPGVTASTQVSSGTWLAQIAAVGAATPAAPAAAVAAVQGIAADLNIMVANIVTNTEGIHTPNQCLLPVNLYVALKQLPRSPAFTDDNALDYLEKMTGLKIEMWPQLNTLGSTGKGRVMVYEKDPEVLYQVQAQPFTQLPPQPKNLAWQVPCMAQVGGVVVLRPAAVTYMDSLAG